MLQISNSQDGAPLGLRQCGSHVSDSKLLSRIKIGMHALPWFCVAIHYGSEDLARDHLTQQRFKFFLPTYPVPTLKNPNRRRHLFPGYGFVSFHLASDKWHRIFNTRGVKSLFMHNEKPVQIRQSTFRQMLTALDSLTFGANPILEPIKPATTPAPFQKGAAVVVQNAGPFNDFHAVVLLSNKQRVQVLYSLFGREAKLTLSNNQIRPLVPYDTSAADGGELPGR